MTFVMLNATPISTNGYFSFCLSSYFSYNLHDGRKGVNHLIVVHTVNYFRVRLISASTVYVYGCGQQKVVKIREQAQRSVNLLRQ